MIVQNAEKIHFASLNDLKKQRYQHNERDNSVLVSLQTVVFP